MKLRRTFKTSARAHNLNILGAIVVAIAPNMAGCSNTQLPSVNLTETANKAIEALPKPDINLLLKPVPKQPVGTPTEVYTRIARGALTCWFGLHGPLKTTHRFHAQADPPAKGGKSDITIYEIPRDKTRKLGDRAFAIEIKPDGTKTSVATENIRFPKAQAERYEADVARWAASEEGCLPAKEVAKDWSAETSKGVQAVTRPKKK